jgi:hypothetical protein
MTEAEAISEIRDYLEGLFPKSCPNCQRHFANLREFVQLTTHQGVPISYDAQAGDWQPLKPLGTVAMSNCSCGSTLVLGSQTMPLPRLWRLLNWARTETRRGNVTPQDLLVRLRDTICAQVLAETGSGRESRNPISG